MEEIIEKDATALTASQTVTKNLYDSFVDFLGLNESPKTVETYTRALKQFFDWIYLNGITRPTERDILEYREELKKDHKPATVQMYITVVRLFFQWASKNGLYEDIASHVKGCKTDKGHKKDYLTSRQIKKVLDTARGDSLEDLRNYAMLALMFTGGLRTIEVSRADIGDIRTVGDIPVLYVQGKGHTEKLEYVKLAPEVEDAIRAYLNARKETSPTEPLFASVSHSNKGDRLTTRSISRITKTAFINAGFNSDRLTAHSCRHSAITLALLGGESLEEVQQFARHSNINTTLIYSHALEKANNSCAATIASAIF